MIPDKTIGRLSLYRRLLNRLIGEGVRSVYSHQLASLARVTPAQVRRDIMSIGYSGNPNRGYDILELVESIGQSLDDPEGQRAALVGVGNLGRAILTYFAGRRPKLTIVAAFDSDPRKCDRVIQGCRCHRIERLADVVSELGIDIGAITVPAGEAQRVADLMVRAGIRGILNYAPVRLQTPNNVYVEDIDMTMSMEKVAYYARKK
ncbi:MAG: redox-sensing transcriptional repressor Rex [Candidatus Latescibacterota bacterium]